MKDDVASTQIRFYDPRKGSFCALSNLHPRPLWFEGRHYLTPEHAYQAFKARDPAVRAWLEAAPTPELVAIAGDALTAEETVAGWAEAQLPLMVRIVAAKFHGSPDLADLLLSTGSRYLVEWSPVDGEVARFWGEFEGEGENHLGRILMALRAELQASPEG